VHDAVSVLLDRGATVSDADRILVAEWLRWIEAQAQKFHDQMHDARSPTEAAGSYANAKTLLGDALALARRLDQRDRFARLEARLNRIKSVFPSQFPRPGTFQLPPCGEAKSGLSEAPRRGICLTNAMLSG
jgi:hypothetical protein